MAERPVVYFSVLAILFIFPLIVPVVGSMAIRSSGHPAVPLDQYTRGSLNRLFDIQYQDETIIQPPL